MYTWVKRAWELFKNQEKKTPKNNYQNLEKRKIKNKRNKSNVKTAIAFDMKADTRS